MTKIDIISGFLGAGKTTLIKKLIAEAYPGEKLVLIENEFGEISIDGGFLKDSGVQISEMSAGCICCTLVGDFNQALMDLGALVCTPLSPRCSRCPWTPWCLAFEQALQDAYPKRLPKPVRQEESFPVFLLFQAGRVLVRKRPPSGMLAGLWEFPHHVDLQAAGDPLCAHRHVFTHRVGNMQLVLALPPRE